MENNINEFVEKLKERFTIDTVGDIMWAEMTLEEIVYDIHAIIEEEAKYFNKGV